MRHSPATWVLCLTSRCVPCSVWQSGSELDDGLQARYAARRLAFQERSGMPYQPTRKRARIGGQSTPIIVLISPRQRGHDPPPLMRIEDLITRAGIEPARSWQIAIALRPFASSASITSRWGSQALAEELRSGCRGGFSAPESVDTSMAGFAAFCPHPPAGRTAIPAARRYVPAVSRRICAATTIPAGSAR